MEEDLVLLENDFEQIREDLADWYGFPKGLVFPVQEEDRGDEKDA